MKQLLLILFLLSFSCGSLASNIPDFPFVLVKGEAEIKVKPDRAKVSFELIEFNKDSKEVVDAISKRGQEIIALAAKYKIGSGDITSSAYTKNTKRAEGPKYQELEILGYEVSQEFTIEINNIADYPALVDQIAALANVRGINPSFDISNKKEIIARLVKEATGDARQKASDLADGLGVKLDSVFAVTQDSDFAAVTAVFGPQDSVNFKARSVAFAAGGGGSNMFVPKYIELNKSVSLVYKIKP
ncbi:MAG TPA: SIMPL domain-containing protein [Cellvibrio sp.]|nr:SIMPL domain-containing protein [Cellvibrio sp.]